MKKLFSLVIGLSGLASTVLAHSEEGFGHHMMDIIGGNNMMNWMYGGFGMGYFGWIIGLLIIVLLVLLIIWLIKQIQKK